jgi:manganese/zinc/iron transport system permease protein
MVIFGFRAFKMISFDEQYSRSIGLPTRFIRLVLMFLTVMVVALGVQSVGVVLMSALLITPAAIGRFFSSNLKGMMLIALLSGIFSGASGALVSYAFPSMPTGPWIVIWLSVLALFAFLFSARKGILVLSFTKWQNAQRIALENFIKSFYPSLKEDQKQLFDLYQLPEPMKAGHANRLLIHARLRGWVKRSGRNQFKFTHEGVEVVKSIVRKHRLWELYLSRYLQLEADHVHDNAEEMEHLITPELEKDLYELLDRPDKDPHDSEIPF